MSLCPQYVDLRTRYSELSTLTNQYIRFISETLRGAWRREGGRVPGVVRPSRTPGCGPWDASKCSGTARPTPVAWRCRCGSPRGGWRVPGAPWLCVSLLGVPALAFSLGRLLCKDSGLFGHGGREGVTARQGTGLSVFSAPAVGLCLAYLQPLPLS